MGFCLEMTHINNNVIMVGGFTPLEILQRLLPIGTH